MTDHASWSSLLASQAATISDYMQLLACEDLHLIARKMIAVLKLYVKRHLLSDIWPYQSYYKTGQSIWRYDHVSYTVWGVAAPDRNPLK